MRNLCRTLTISLCAALLAAGTLTFADADARSIRYDLNIPSEDLTAALQSFAIASHHKLLYKAELTAGKTSRALKGHFTAQEAIEALLAGTGLTFQITGSSVVLIRDQNGGSAGVLHEESSTPRAIGDDPNGASSSAKEGKKSSQDFRLAQVDQGKNSSTATISTANPTNNQSSGPALTEIIVTAQKRSERLQDVPVPVTAISAGSLVESNQLRLQDYYTRIPGLSVTLGGDEGAPLLAIRGITTGGTVNPTVAIVVDDVPYGSSTVYGGGYAAPDIDPSDLGQVEVLRGPQGTLYGASSIGGLIKFVTVDPSTDGVSGRVQAGTSSVHNGAEMGYSVSGAANVPLSDTLALRASAFTRLDPGYIDDPTRHVNGVNEGHAQGGRLAALWRPAQDLTVKLSALIQDTKTNGSSEVHLLPGLVDLQQSALGGTGGYDKKKEAYSATVNAKLGSAELTSVSGYSINRVMSDLDGTPLLGTLFTLPRFGVTGTPNPRNNETKKFSEEIRFSVPIGQRLEWLLGGFYTHESTSQLTDILAENTNTGAVVGSWYHASIPTTYAEYAAFTDLTVHFTDQFDIQVGGRESHNRQTYSSVEVGPYVTQFFGQVSPLITPQADSSDNSFTYLVTPQFKVSSDLMVYARLASGYRPGGPNTSVTALRRLNLPTEFKADTTQNYELGVKGNALDRRLFFDASLYYINWKDIQLQLVDPTTFTSFFGNGGRAKSEGVELSVESKPLTGLAIAAWLAYNDAKLSQSFPPLSQGGTAVGASDERLPYSSRFSGNLALDQDFPLASNVTGFVGGTVSYVGDREGVFPSAFASPPLRQSFPSYTETDLRTGVRLDGWKANLYVNNVGDRRGVLRGGLDSFLHYSFNYIEPRTVGLSFAKNF